MQIVLGLVVLALGIALVALGYLLIRSFRSRRRSRRLRSIAGMRGTHDMGVPVDEAAFADIVARLRRSSSGDRPFG